MSANPLLDYVGQLSADQGANAPVLQFITSDLYLSGRYFFSATRALRLHLRIAAHDSVAQEQVTVGNGTQTRLEDRLQRTQLWLGAGLEWRRGQYGRFQGYYGADVLLGYASLVSEDQYYNASQDRMYTAEYREKASLNVNVLAFIGVEYFLLPKMSLAGELGWGLHVQRQGDTSSTNGVPGATQIVQPGGRAIMLDTARGLQGATLRLGFCF